VAMGRLRRRAQLLQRPLSAWRLVALPVLVVRLALESAALLLGLGGMLVLVAEWSAQLAQES
jgi:hypothetical protein